MAALAAPIAAPAAVSSTSQAPAVFHMQTRLYDTYHPFEIDGQMNLNVYPSGIVNGFYIPADTGGVREVTGGVMGQSVWLDIGGVHSLHLTGTLKDGVLRTTAFIPGPDTWVFESTKVARQPG
jgi:tRNA A37 threonylcarbamoyladenosine synthetase subunit TsaC/SUA5/YrdC